MRILSAGPLALAFAMSGCAALAGLGDYKEQPAHDDTALNTTDGTAPDSDAASPGSDDNGDEETGSEDGGLVFESGPLPDIDLDAPPPCGAGNCGGCCMNGECVGGHSVNTCGTGGALCKDCTNNGGSCSSSGQCKTAAPVDAAAPPPACKASSCTGCIPFYQMGCCKADQTCGCEVSFSNSCK
jgi:hypothetical protein